MQTQGFQLSQFDRAPQIPSNIGVVDTKSIYGSVVDALKSFEAARTAQVAQKATDAQLGLAADKATTEQGLLSSEADARRAQANFLASPEYNRARQLLSGVQAEGAQEELRAKRVEQERKTRLLQQAALQEQEVSDAIHGALEYATPETRADEFTKIRAKYRWLDLPEYKNLSDTLDTHYKSAVNAAERAAARDSAAELAEIRLRGVLGAAETRAGAGTSDTKLLDRVAELRRRVNENPEDEEAHAQLAAAVGLLNAKSAEAAKNPNAALVQKQTDNANKARALIGSAAQSIDETNQLIDQTDALVKAHPASVGFISARFAPINILDRESRSAAQDVAANTETLRANILLQTLKDLKSTGATLGQVTENEGRQLAAAVRVLSTTNLSPESYRAALRAIKTHQDRLLKRLKSDFKLNYGQDYDATEAAGEKGLFPASGSMVPQITTQSVVPAADAPAGDLLKFYAPK